MDVTINKYVSLGPFLERQDDCFFFVAGSHDLQVNMERLYFALGNKINVDKVAVLSHKDLFLFDLSKRKKENNSFGHLLYNIFPDIYASKYQNTIQLKLLNFRVQDSQFPY